MFSENRTAFRIKLGQTWNDDDLVVSGGGFDVDGCHAARDAVDDAEKRRVDVACLEDTDILG